MNKLTGLVMCGGASSRMGRDKGLITGSDGRTWAEIAYQKLEQVVGDVFVSVNVSQVETYSRIFSPSVLIVDALDIKGPLTGILSASAQMESDWLIMACDMPDINLDILWRMKDVYRTEKSLFYVSRHEKGIEPLLSIYTQKGLNPVLEKAKAGKLDSYAVNTLFSDTDTFYINFEHPDVFLNLNSL